MRVGLIGAGNMATALARGWNERVLVTDALPERAESLAAEVGGSALASNADLAEQADLVVLCHKPAQLAEVAEQVGGRAKALVSILAATRIAELEDAYPGVPVYRFIPNLPAEVRQGVLCYAPGSRAADGPEDEVLELFGRVGTIVPLDEPLIEPAMAVMSSSPAFFASVVEALADAGTRHGLAADDAARLVVETMGGTAAYMRAHELDGPALRARVATPGGVTERGLAALEEHGLADAFGAAVDVVVEATKR
jgi:pyrroline-5-carboxylate reductase